MHRCMNIYNICVILELKVSGETLRLSLKARGIVTHPATQKPLILATYRSNRFIWARARQNWTIDE